MASGDEACTAHDSMMGHPPHICIMVHYVNSSVWLFTWDSFERPLAQARRRLVKVIPCHHGWRRAECASNAHDIFETSCPERPYWRATVAHCETTA